MGLKCKNKECQERCKHELKSDQNGIEIVLDGGCGFAEFSLKSDQNGIEIVKS